MKLNLDFVRPDGRPDQCPEIMWELQLTLDNCAQQLFGKRSPDKVLLRPQFVKDGPRVWNTYEPVGGLAQLNLNAAGDWSLAIFQLAHETIHLLDPRPAYPVGIGASWFEEGLAVNFSIAVSKEIGNPSIKVGDDKYNRANQLFSRIGGDLFHRAMQVRSRSGHFSDAKASDLLAVSPKLPEHIAEKLVSSFYS
ncbi:hypothetical protein [Pseudomonas lactis]|uniref:hypothetical protein n=1 Tax=Pseudomonas lactis TaxID=1615674 RepID=UPI003F7FC923